MSFIEENLSRYFISFLPHFHRPFFWKPFFYRGDNKSQKYLRNPAETKSFAQIFPAVRFQPPDMFSCFNFFRVCRFSKDEESFCFRINVMRNYSATQSHKLPNEPSFYHHFLRDFLFALKLRSRKEFSSHLASVHTLIPILLQKIRLFEIAGRKSRKLLSRNVRVGDKN